MTDPVKQGLDRLRIHTADERPSNALEARLVKAFRAEHTPPPVFPRRWLWVPAAAAACVLAALGWRMTAGKAPVVEAPVLRVQNEPKRIAKSLAPPERNNASTPLAHARGSETSTKLEGFVPSHDRKGVVRNVFQQPPRAGEFFEIPYAPALSDYDSGQVVRVNLRGSSVWRLGVPVLTDKVQADVLVGDDGIARAIRLVSDSGLNSIR